MAEKVDWIVSCEHSQGCGKIFLGSHNGHIEKSGAAATYRSMGSRLKEKYGDQYFAIGTEFYKGSFNNKETDSGVCKLFSVMNKNPLNSTFESTGQKVAYLDIQLALENPALAALLTSKQPMTNIGDEFSAIYRYFPRFYTIRMVSSDAYDALIFVRAATPTTMLNND